MRPLGAFSLTLTLVMTATLSVSVSSGLNHAQGAQGGSGGRARPPPTYADERRANRGPGPIDSGDAAARHARAVHDGKRKPDMIVRYTPRPKPPHGGWGARRGHLTHGGAGRDGLGNHREEHTKPVLRRHLLSEALRREAEQATGLSAKVAAAAAAAAAKAAAERGTYTTMWPSLQDVPAGLRCSGRGAARRGGRGSTTFTTTSFSSHCKFFFWLYYLRRWYVS